MTRGCHRCRQRHRYRLLLMKCELWVACWIFSSCVFTYLPGWRADLWVYVCASHCVNAVVVIFLRLFISFFFVASDSMARSIPFLAIAENVTIVVAKQHPNETSSCENWLNDETPTLHWCSLWTLSCEMRIQTLYWSRLCWQTKRSRKNSEKKDETKNAKRQFILLVFSNALASL